jgi:hypothetical protein
LKKIACLFLCVYRTSCCCHGVVGVVGAGGGRGTYNEGHCIINAFSDYYYTLSPEILYFYSSASVGIVSLFDDFL